MARYRNEPRKRIPPLTILVLFVAIGLSSMAQANIKYARRTGKSCGYCHVKIGGGGKLTSAGKKFRNAGYALAESNGDSYRLLLIAAIGFILLVGGIGTFLFLKKRHKKPKKGVS